MVRFCRSSSGSAAGAPVFAVDRISLLGQQPMICGIYRDYHFPLPLHGAVRDETDTWEENCPLQDQQNQIFEAFAISYSDQPEPVPELYVEMRGHEAGLDTARGSFHFRVEVAMRADRGQN